MSASAMHGGRNKVKWQIHHDVSLSVKTQTYDSRNKPQIHHVVRSGIKNKCNFFTGLRFEVEQASCGLSAIAELLVEFLDTSHIFGMA